MLDKTDKDLLRELQIDSHRNTSQLSKKLGVPRTTVHNRMKHLEKEGYIKGYRAIVDGAKVGRPLTVLMGVVAGEEIGAKELAENMKKFPQIEDVYIVSGQYDLILKLRLKDTTELASLIFHIDQGIRSIHGITKTESMIVLETDKEFGVTEPL
jgi:DNA-binding Lrp family transcriptional regulator